MKYVILRLDMVDLGVEKVFPFVFPESLTHSEVAKHMVHMIGWELGDVPEVYSAGFCHIHNNEFQVERGSESLKIAKGHPAQGHMDYRILNQPNAMQGMMPC